MAITPYYTLEWLLHVCACMRVSVHVRVLYFLISPSLFSYIDKKHFRFMLSAGALASCSQSDSLIRRSKSVQFWRDFSFNHVAVAQLVLKKNK